MDDCAILKSDMRTLILAFPKLKSLLYWTVSKRTGPSHFTAAELIEVLDPVKDTLEELQAEIHPCWDESFDNEGHIDTMSHFTALNTLDTTPEMWWNLSAKVFESNFGLVGLRLVTDEQRFASQLPPFLQTLRLHIASTTKTGIFDMRYLIAQTLGQILDIILRAPQLLRNLKDIFMDSLFAAHAQDLHDLIDNYADVMGNLTIKFGVGESCYGPSASP
ncbi:hypothetical protein E8E11_008769 [Didymella keratinophila]|nr:hypothetical protein E8E11_008769 [Didymella keratinophila]